MSNQMSISTLPDAARPVVEWHALRDVSITNPHENAMSPRKVWHHFSTNAMSPRKVWHSFSEATSAFFMSADGQSDDPLAQLMRLYPTAANRFIRVVLGWGGLINLAVLAMCSIYLIQNWDECGQCHRPLRFWLVVYVALSSAGVPVRVLFIARVLCTGTEDGQLCSIIDSITASPAWYVSKKVSLMIYAWFLFGGIWILNAFGAPACSGIHKLILGVLIISGIRSLAALVSLRLMFPEMVMVEEECEPVSEGASQSDIAALRKYRFRQQDFDDPCASCAVCLAEYENGDLLRELPCGHSFHCACADKWLGLNKRCPLCVQPIDAMPNNLHKMKLH